MSWTLPVPLLLFAGVVALLPLAALVRRPTSAPRLMVEAFAVSLAVIGVVWAGWLALWLLEHRARRHRWSRWRRARPPRE